MSCECDPKNGIPGLIIAIIVFLTVLTNGVKWPLAIIGGIFWPATIIIWLITQT